MQYAGFGKRFIAAWIDLFVLAPLIALSVWLEGMNREIAAISGILAAAVFWLYPVIFLALWGQTVGKRAVRVRVRTVTGDPIGWNEAVKRSSVDGVLSLLSMTAFAIAIYNIPASEFASLNWMERQTKINAAIPASLSWVGIAANIWGWGELITLLFNDKRRALHDFIAGTVVVIDDARARDGV